MAVLKSVEELRKIYGEPHQRSVAKEIHYLNEPYQAFVKASPFAVLASNGPQGTDCSPKGDVPGFVRIIDEKTLALPDRPGNNRIDSFENIIADPRVSLLFIVPGAGETLRVNGRGEISIDPELLASFAVGGRLPRTVLIISVESAYFHCSRAIVRSQLWDATRFAPRGALPTPGEMLAAICEGFDSADYDRALPERVKKTLY